MRTLRWNLQILAHFTLMLLHYHCPILLLATISYFPLSLFSIFSQRNLLEDRKYTHDHINHQPKILRWTLFILRKKFTLLITAPTIFSGSFHRLFSLSFSVLEIYKAVYSYLNVSFSTSLLGLVPPSRRILSTLTPGLTNSLKFLCDT